MDQLVSSLVVSGVRPPRRTVVGVAVVGLVVTALTLTALGIQAARGNAIVDVQLQAKTRHDAALDDAFYRCIDVQARSLVSPHEPVYLIGTLGDWVTLTKGVGSWIDIAPSLASAQAIVGLRDNVTGRPACLGTVVVDRPTHPQDGTTIRFGSGASVPGTGPPPAPPL